MALKLTRMVFIKLFNFRLSTFTSLIVKIILFHIYIATKNVAEVQILLWFKKQNAKQNFRIIITSYIS